MTAQWRRPQSLVGVSPALKTLVFRGLAFHALHESCTGVVARIVLGAMREKRFKSERLRVRLDVEILMHQRLLLFSPISWASGISGPARSVAHTIHRCPPCLLAAANASWFSLVSIWLIASLRWGMLSGSRAGATYECRWCRAICAMLTYESKEARENERTREGESASSTRNSSASESSSSGSSAP